MGFSKINAMSLTDLFVQQVENMILSGELNIGEQLPSARELCVKMGVSRPVISAGMVELEKMGFVEIHPRKGVFVSDYRRKGTLETLVAIMRYNGGAMRRKVQHRLPNRRADGAVFAFAMVTPLVKHVGGAQQQGQREHRAKAKRQEPVETTGRGEGISHHTCF